MTKGTTAKNATVFKSKNCVLQGGCIKIQRGNRCKSHLGSVRLIFHAVSKGYHEKSVTGGIQSRFQVKSPKKFKFSDFLGP